MGEGYEAMKFASLHHQLLGLSAEAPGMVSCDSLAAEPASGSTTIVETQPPPESATSLLLASGFISLTSERQQQVQRTGWGWEKFAVLGYSRHPLFLRGVET